MRARPPRGFSLVELVVTMLIAGILAAIAIPAYSSYVRQSRRTEAKSALLDLASLEERYFSTAYSYTAAPENLGYPPPPSGQPDVLTNQTVGSGYYQVSVTSVVPATPTSTAQYTLVAIPKPGTDQTNDTSCAQFTVTQSGLRTALNSAGADNTANCW